DNIAAELGRVGLGHDDIFPAKTNLHRSGVNQTGGSPESPPPKPCNDYSQTQHSPSLQRPLETAEPLRAINRECRLLLR
ncbi:hypothetical protein, partial [Cryobacterium sp. TMT3-29-2]|uniref:hypothetical protein n=1 Tax=Cryobacterium sp. TMT3-29-2 TaxID=2555867 RepID=UPI001A7E13E7